MFDLHIIKVVKKASALSKGGKGIDYNIKSPFSVVSPTPSYVLLNLLMQVTKLE